MNRASRQTFTISDTLSKLKKISDGLEMSLYPPMEAKEMIYNGTKMSLMLMMTYPERYFLPEESDFLNDFMDRLRQYNNEYGDYNNEF